EACDEVSSSNGVCGSSRKKFRPDSTPKCLRASPAEMRISSASESEASVKTEPVEDACIISSREDRLGQVSIKDELMYKEEVFVAEFAEKDTNKEDSFTDLDSDQIPEPSPVLLDDRTNVAPENIKESSVVSRSRSQKSSRLIKPKIMGGLQAQTCEGLLTNQECVSDVVQEAHVTQHSDCSWQVLEDMLPTMFSHKLVTYYYIPDNNLPGLNLEVDSTVSSKEGVRLWIQEFSERTQTNWKYQACIMGSTYSFTCKMLYVCLGTSKSKKEKGKGDRTCSAFIHIKLYDTDVLREVNHISAGFFSRISLSYVHNHSVMFKEVLQYKSVKKEIVEMFHKYFSEGHSPTSSHHFHEARLWLRVSAAELLTDETINPKIQTIQYMSDQWEKCNSVIVKKSKFNEKSEDFFNAVCEKVDELSHKINVQYFLVKVPLSVALVTPMMKRVHNIPEASLIVFVNTVNNCGQDKCSITYFVCASVAGVLPLGVVIVSNPTCNAFKVAFRNLVTTVGESAFGGRGAPMVIISDGFEPQRDALIYIFPFSHVLLCVTHLVRSVWRWLTEDSNSIREDHRVTLMSLVKNVLYAPSPDASKLSYKALLENSISKEYKVFHTYLATLWHRRSEVGLVYKLPLNNKDFIELSRRIFIDAILTRCQAFNFLPLMDYACIAVEECFQSRICEFIENTASRFTFLKCMEESISPETKTVKSSYKVQNIHDKETWFTVDCEASVCSCVSGCMGGLCEHQRAVCKLQNVQLPSPPEIDAAGKLQLAEIAFGEAGYQGFNKIEYDFTIKALKKNLTRLETIASQNITNSFIGKIKQLNQTLDKITSLNELGTFCEMAANTQSQMAIRVNILQPQNNLLQPHANIVHPQTNIMHSQASMVQQQTNFVQPQSNIVQPHTSRTQASIVQSQTNIVPSQTGVVQPHSNTVHPQANIVQPQTSIVQPQASVGVNPVQFLVVQSINK
ncbi:hypothetical protein OTU49_001737, partial [Cherax quadricarinatus]